MINKSTLCCQSVVREMFLPEEGVEVPLPFDALSAITTTSFMRYRSDDETERLYLFSNISRNLNRGSVRFGTSCKSEATSLFKVSWSTICPIENTELLFSQLDKMINASCHVC